MTNTDFYYTIAKQFQDERKHVIDKYEKRVSELESTKGSKYFTDEMKAAESRKKDSLDALIAEYGAKLNSALSLMKKTNESRSIVAPTQEQLNIIAALKMLEKPNSDDLLQAANACANCDVAMRILGEMAISHQIPRSIFDGISREMTVSAANDVLTELAAQTRDFLNHDTKRIARIYADTHLRHYDEEIDADSLKKRNLFDSKKDCFAELGLSEDTLKAFAAAVDGE